MLMDVLQRHRNVNISIMKKDQETFLLYRQIRLPGLSKVLLGILSFFIVAVMSLMTFESWWTGPFVIFAVTFTLSAYWVVVTELEDPVRGVWFRNEVPREWLESEASAADAQEGLIKRRRPGETSFLGALTHFSTLYTLMA